MRADFARKQQVLLDYTDMLRSHDYLAGLNCPVRASSSARSIKYPVTPSSISSASASASSKYRMISPRFAAWSMDIPCLSQVSVRELPHTARPLGSFLPADAVWLVEEIVAVA
jgi:hypothetical protein